MSESIEGYTLKQDFWTRQQREAFVKSIHLKHFAYFMDPRTGKSKPNVDKACFHFERKTGPLHIRGVLVVAWPNGVHRGWITDAFPENVPARIPWRGFTWRANEANHASKKAARNKKAPLHGYMKQFVDLCSFKGMAVLAVNAESLRLSTTKNAIDYFLKSRERVMCIADETCFMAEPDTTRARYMMALGRRKELVIKSILDGTPVDGNPFGYYAPVKFLSRDILGFDQFQLFKAHFAEFKQSGDRDFWIQVSKTKSGIIKSREQELIDKGMNPVEAKYAVKKDDVDEIAQGRAKKSRSGRFWTEIKKDARGYPEFKNMDELHDKLDPISYRATFEQCFNTPRKVYQKHYFEISEEQRRVYNELREEYRASLHDGTEITATHHLSRMLRAQQICSNYYPEQKVIKLHESCGGMGCEICEDSGVVESTIPAKVIDPLGNPRIEALRAELENGKPTIIWTRFKQDAVDCYALCKEMGITACTYNGQTKDKADSKDGFQSGKYNVIIGQWQSMARGLPLWRAYGHVMYSNGWSRRDRQQGEDRAEIAHRTVGTSIVDIVAEDTVDDLAIIPALRMNMEVSAMIMRDPQKVWI